jgi:Bifunctional DNA primase/polymerase, N-terminal
MGKSSTSSWTTTTPAVTSAAGTSTRRGRAGANDGPHPDSTPRDTSGPTHLRAGSWCPVSSSTRGEGFQPEPSPFLLTAQRLVACGCNVIPLQPRDKKPATNWKPLQSTRLVDRDWDEVDRYLYSWWGDGKDHGLGVVTGAVSEIVVVDVDSDEAREIVEQTCGWPRTVTAKTAKGWHLYFRHPGAGTRNGVRRGQVALDVRGDGGYVVAPPSVHPSGFEYRWQISPFTFAGGMWPPAVMPDELHALLWPTSHVTATTAPVTVHTTKYVDVALEREVATVSSATEGTRNDQLNKSAFALARFVHDGALAASTYVEHLTAAAMRTGLGETEIRRTLASALQGWS